MTIPPTQLETVVSKKLTILRAEMLVLDRVSGKSGWGVPHWGHIGHVSNLRYLQLSSNGLLQSCINHHYKNDILVMQCVVWGNTLKENDLLFCWRHSFLSIKWLFHFKFHCSSAVVACENLWTDWINNIIIKTETFFTIFQLWADRPLVIWMPNLGGINVM